VGPSSTGADRQDWGSDFFGGLNELPAEAIAGIDQVLEAMSRLPAFHDARRWVLDRFGIAKGGAILEAGCGNAASLSDILAVVGPTGRIVGIDPTKAFVESANQRSRNMRASNAHYEVGDIRSIAHEDGAFDGTFCDKVLIHAGPVNAALFEMARVTRPGGHVGAIEWLPFFAISTSDLSLLAPFNAIFAKAVYEYMVSANLARHFRGARFQDIEVKAFLAHADSLDEHPFWRAFIVHQMPMFVGAGLIDEAESRAFLDDIERLNAKGEFSASFMVHAAVGMKVS